MAAAETVEIRRYPNRRFYDRSRSRYVTLQEIEEMVLQGHTITVLDSKSGEDLTRQVLTQILLERHPDKMALIPVAMLHSILRANDIVLDFWREYLRRSLGALESHQHESMPFASPLDWIPSFFPGVMPMPRPATESPDALARRLAELESRIGRLEPRVEPASPSAPENESIDPKERRPRSARRQRTGGGKE
jgi:polyhydroxyalkanoate synthesis repressor PhaR